MLSRTFASIGISTTLIILATSLLASFGSPWHSYPKAFSVTVADLGPLLIVFLAVSAFVGTGTALLMPVVAVVRRTVKSPANAAAVIIASGALLGPALFLAIGVPQDAALAPVVGCGALSAAVWSYLNRGAISVG